MIGSLEVLNCCVNLINYLVKQGLTQEEILNIMKGKK